MKRLKETWQKIRQTNARIKADKRQRSVADWQSQYPDEYNAWLSAGCPEIFIYKPIITYEDELDE